MRHAVAVCTDGTLTAWGSDSHGQVEGTPTGAGFVSVAAGGYHSYTSPKIRVTFSVLTCPAYTATSDLLLFSIGPSTAELHWMPMAIFTAGVTTAMAKFLTLPKAQGS